MKNILLKRFLFSLKDKGLIVVCAVLLSVSAYAKPPENPDKVLVKKINVTGFKLHDAHVYKQLNAKYRNQRLNDGQIQAVIEELLAAYRMAGYVRLVDATHKYRKGVLTIHISLAKE